VPHAHSATAPKRGLERQVSLGARTHCRHAGSDAHALACSGHSANAHCWHAELTPPPASRGGGVAVHCPEVHAQGASPQDPPMGPEDMPRQQRPPHQPHVERPVQSEQLVALMHSSAGAPLSLGGVPASEGVSTHEA